MKRAKRVVLLRAELEAAIDAISAALAGPTDWQDAACVDMTEEEEERWMEASTSALESAREKLSVLLEGLK